MQLDLMELGEWTVIIKFYLVDYCDIMHIINLINCLFGVFIINNSIALIIIC